MNSSVKKKYLAVLSFLSASILAIVIVQNLAQLHETADPEICLVRISLSLAAFFLPILGGWASYGLIGGALFSFFASIVVVFIGTVTSAPVFFWLLIEYAAFSYLAYRVIDNAEDQIAGISVDREKFQNEKNDLEVAHKAKGEGISILFEKYSTYYNLRKLAEDLAKSLSVGQLSQTIVHHCQEFVGKGDVALLALGDNEGLRFNLSAYHSFSKNHPWDILQYSGTDLFDFWVIKNQRRLIVTDTHQDFRFDIKETSRRTDLRSVILTPVTYERRVIGTLRINSSVADAFSNDDLRVLDTIAVLASSALSNAMLYEKTEELAIKDSLTGLYVRRYFFDRFKEEHRRALVTHRPLSLLMCDLDHFKECNDRYGHGVGDLMLIEFSQILRSAVDNAIVARYGGEEFAVLIPETTKKDAADAAERIRARVASNPFTIRRQPIEMTVSIGVASMPDDALDLELILHNADQALYSAKRQGRNRVCLSGS